MTLIDNIAIGLQASLTLNALAYCFIGCLLGTLIGVLPGLGPAAAIAMLLPATFALEPSSALIMIAGIYYGAQYGGSTTAILVNLPGEATSVVTAIDGYQMAKQGRAGVALATAALSSFFAGTVATLVIAAFAGPLSEVAQLFGAAEYFSLMVLGLIASVVLASGSLIKALCMICVGLLLGMVGTDLNSGMPRFDLGQIELLDGINIVVVAMGVFGIAEVIRNLTDGEDQRSLQQGKLTGLMPSWADIKAMFPAAVRGTMLGSVLGVLPGGGALLSSFAAYSVEKKLARDPSRFGKGAIEGVAGPEAANNAGAQTSFIPLLALGIPSNAIMALIVGALIIHGIQPGPGMLREQPSLFWGLIVSMWIGNLMLLVLNLPLVGLWARLVTIPYHFLYPAILVFCVIGVATLNNNTFDIGMMIMFGALGYVFIRLECEPAPLLLGIILGPMLEDNLRTAMLLSRGDPLTFIQRPVSAVLLGLAIVALIAMASPHLRTQREEALKE